MSGKWFLGTSKYHYTTDGKLSLCSSYLVNGKPLQDTPPSTYSTCAVCRARSEKQAKPSPTQAVAISAQPCPSCKGTGEYVGLFETSPCHECEGRKVVAVAAPTQLAREAPSSAVLNVKFVMPDLSGIPNTPEALTLDANSNVWPAATRPNPGDLLVSPEIMKDVRDWLVEDIDEATRQHCYGSLAEAAELTKILRPDPGINLGTTNQLSSTIAAAPHPDRNISYSGYVIQGGVLPCGEQLLELGKRGPYHRYLDFPQSSDEMNQVRAKSDEAIHRILKKRDCPLPLNPPNFAFKLRDYSQRGVTISGSDDSSKLDIET